MGIDFGDKRVGLALGELGGSAFPYKVIANENREDLLKNINVIIKEENIECLVVGLPHSLSGHDNERLRTTEDFVALLQANVDIPVETVDERLTSKLYSRQGVTKDIDKHAATAILDTYLEIHAR